MSVKTETQHQGEFLISEAPGSLSREQGVLSSGQKVVDGQVLKWSGGELVEAAGTIDSGGDSTEDIAGIAFGAYDASSTGPKGAVDTPIAYIARLAEVNDDKVTYHESGTNAAAKTAAIKAVLATKFIIPR